MQAQQPISSDVQANTESSIKRYLVEETFSGNEVTLEVNHTILTAEHAEEINNFWGSPKSRIAAENGDAVKAVIRMAGTIAARMFFRDGWGETDFRAGDTDVGDSCSKQFRAEEGWGGENGTPYGWCGIRILAASIELPDFEEFRVKEVP